MICRWNPPCQAAGPGSLYRQLPRSGYPGGHTACGNCGRPAGCRGRSPHNCRNWGGCWQPPPCRYTLPAPAYLWWRCNPLRGDSLIQSGQCNGNPPPASQKPAALPWPGAAPAVRWVPRRCWSAYHQQEWQVPAWGLPQRKRVRPAVLWFPPGAAGRRHRSPAQPAHSQGLTTAGRVCGISASGPPAWPPGPAQKRGHRASGAPWQSAECFRSNQRVRQRERCRWRLRHRQVPCIAQIGGTPATPAGSTSAGRRPDSTAAW